MPRVYYGTKNEPGFDLEQSDDLIAVRTRSRRSVRNAGGPVPTPVTAELADGTLVVAFPEAGVEVYRVPVGRGARSLDERKSVLRAAPDVRFAGGVLVDGASKEPVLYTENIFIKFVDTADPDDCLEVLREAGLKVKYKVDFATNAYFVEAPEGTGQGVFDIATALLKRDDVEFCHPELIRRREPKNIPVQQWHLKKTTIGGVVIDAHASVEGAHQVTLGDGVVIAIIDDGVDIDHAEFQGIGKIVSPRDATMQSNDPRPKDPRPDDPENHGTACAGVACGNGTNGASGVAPRAKLMPIRLASGLGSQREADAFKWAADNGADVISCSWGPEDGRWFVKNDPLHKHVSPLPTSTRLAIDYATANGRGGKGCVVLFAAGNGNESVDNDGYASYPKVTAVAACNDRGRRSVYSDFGKAVWCAFPSNDFGHVPSNHPEPLTPGIWTTDRQGEAGYNSGLPADGDVAGHYTNGFGGTSSSCPGAAGVVALILSVNPALRWQEVKELLKRSCDRIDPSGGQYDATGHSPKYGYGRLNALTAVELAKPQPQSGITIKRTFDAPIPDMMTVTATLEVADNTPVEALTVAVNIKHTFIGDLVITLEPPAGIGVAPVVLHDRAGGSTNNLKKQYDAATTPALSKFADKGCKGTWTLRIQDAAQGDSGTLVSFSLSLSFAHSDRAPTPRVTADKSRRSAPRKIAQATAPARQKASSRSRKHA